MAAKGTYIPRGKQAWHVAVSPVVNIDNGSGTTVDYVPISGLSYDIEIMEAKFVYTEATDTAGAASAKIQVGTTAGGQGIVAQTTYQVSKAVGSTTSLTIVDGYVPAGGAVFYRHTGIATTEAGQGFLQLVYRGRTA